MEFLTGSALYYIFILLVLISLIVAGNPAAGLAKGVEVNDKNYLDRFPFLAPAHQGLYQGHGGTNFPTEPNIPIP